MKLPHLGPPWPRVLIIFGQAVIIGYSFTDIEKLLWHNPVDLGSLARSTILILFNFVLALYNVKYAFQDAQKERAPSPS